MTQDGTPNEFLEDEARWAQWMKAAQSGDQVSYRQLLLALEGAIGAYLRRHFGPWDMLEDCVQECLLAIHQARHTYDAHRAFRPWLFTIVRHKAIDMLRRRGRQPESQAIGGEQAEMLLAQQFAPEQADSLSLSEQLFSELPGHFRQALLLTKIYGLSMREAAGQEGVTEAAMKVRVHRAIQALRKQLQTD